MKHITLILVLTACMPLTLMAEDHFQHGNKSYLQGDYGDALNSYNQFIQKEPKKFEGYYNAGNALFRQGQYEQALQMYNKALELNPKDEDTKANIAVTQDRIKNQPQDKKKAQSSEPKAQGKKDQGQQGNKGQAQSPEPKAQGKNSQGQQGQNQQGNKGQGDKQGQNGQQAQQAQEQPKQPPEGMTKDEVQALLNTMQNQEKQYRGYFGKQQERQNNEPDMFNMSPEQIMRYMQRQMMDPNMTQQEPKGDSKEKDW